jgi:small conductance mechanosensitive channel
LAPQGFQFSSVFEPETTLGALLLALAMVIMAALASWLLGRLMTRSGWVMGKLGRKVDETFIRYALRFKTLLIFLTAGIFYASLVPGLRALLGTLVAGAGITAIVVGFAAKSSLANLVSGLSITIYRPFRIGDKVTIEKEYGTIEDITLRHTIMRTWEHKRLIIPNEKIDSMIIVNHSIVDPKVLCRVEVGVSYDTDIDLARRLMLEEAAKCPYKMPDELAPNLPRVRVANLADFAIIMRLFMWAPTPDDAWKARFWALEQIKKRFDKEGVEIPFPYRTLVYKKDLPPAPKEQLPPGPSAE